MKAVAEKKLKEYTKKWPKKAPKTKKPDLSKKLKSGFDDEKHQILKNME